MLSHDFGAQRKTIPGNMGKTVYWNRFTPLTVSTTALTEGSSNPAFTEMTTTQVTTSVATYGKATAVADLFTLTSLDVNLKEHVEVHAQNCGETLDSLIRNELISGATAQIVSGLALSAVAATNTMSGAEVRKAVRTLKVNKAQRFENGFYRGIINPYASYDLFGNTEWLNSISIYTDPTQLKAGIVGKLHGVEFVETNNDQTVASSVTVYQTFVFGKNAYGTVSLDNQPGNRVYVKVPGPNSTDNPIDIYSTVGWKAYFAVKTLNANWIINIQTGATA